MRKGLVTKRNYALAEFDRKRRNKSKTIPSQALSIREILTRYSRNINIDVKKYDGTYIDGDEDLEKVSRMDFGDKFAYAQDLREENERFVNELREAKEAERAAAQEATHRSTQQSDQSEAAGSEAVAGERGASPPAKK